MASSKSPIVIVGAGPTGLLCSIWLSRYGVPHRIIDKLSAPGLASRAMGVHARTLEIYRSLGIADTIVKLGHAFRSYSFFYHGEPLFSVPIGHAGDGLSYYPIVLSITQDEHEEVLEKHLATLGTTVEREVELLHMGIPDGASDNVKIVLRHKSGQQETLSASYVVGCDGARSIVRQAAGIAMEGGTYPNAFYVADVICSGPMQTSGRMNLFVTRGEYACFLPLPHREGRARIIGLVPKDLDGKADLCFDNVRPLIKIAAPALEIEEVQWFATYKVHHRCAAQFQLNERIFLCGDAAHLHSPVGAQGMNTGLGDASNLAWKLATAWHGADRGKLDTKALLASYETERRPFAQDLVNTTDTFFKYFTDDGWRGYMVRNFVVYYVLPLVNRIVNVGRHMYKLESQIAISYPRSTLSQSIGGQGKLKGERLPWVEVVKSSMTDSLQEGDNHAVLDAAGWQAHVYGGDDGDVASKAPWLRTIEPIFEQHRVEVKTFQWNESTSTAGFAENTIHLVRPDGYIGLTIEAGALDIQQVDDYLNRFGSRWLHERPVQTR